MDNPIKPTPTLYGEDAEHFLKIIEEPPSPESIEFIKEILETFADFDPFIEIPDEIHTSRKIEE